MENALKRMTVLGRAMARDGYDEESVHTTLRRLKAEAEPEPFLAALERYYTAGTQKILTSRGVSTLVLTRQMEMEYPSALATILWLRQEPEEALEALAYETNGEIGGMMYE
ncbi:MAG: hypothetical protein IIV90_07500 [Oscillospiraceae bacterium]|nr:hypothetical protein [Oscillospiraceae bacterium]